MMTVSGSSIHILKEKRFQENTTKRPVLQVTSTRVFPYQSDKPLKCKMQGKFESNINTENDITSQETVNVTEGAGGLLLSWRASQNLELISVAKPLSSSDQRTEIIRLVNVFNNLFTGLGKLKVKLHIDDIVQPSAQPHRRITLIPPKPAA